MRIIIAGAGDLGFHLAKLLSHEQQDIVLIDNDPDVLQYAATHLDIHAIQGDSASIRVLDQAEVSKASLFLSMTTSEKNNLMSCILAKKMGASITLNVTKDSIDDAMDELGMLEGFDVGMEVSGVPSALRDMLRTMHHGGRVALLGIPPGETAIDWNDVIFKGLKLKGIYGREMFETWYKMSAMLESGLDITPIITHHFPVNDFQQAFEIMRSGQSGKIILDWT